MRRLACGTDRRFKEKQFHSKKESGDTKGAKNDHFIILYLNVYGIWKAGAVCDPSGMGNFESAILPGVCTVVPDNPSGFGTGLYSAADLADWGGDQFRAGESGLTIRLE